MNLPYDPFAPFRLDGRVALVTGASSGLGSRFARVLAAAGASVVVVARRADRIGNLAAELPDAMAVPADITDPAAAAALVKRVTERYGRVDILVNNAGVADTAPALDEPLELFRSAMEVNLTAAFHLSQLVARDMLARGSGTIVNIASVLGFRSAGQIPQAGYAASKAGLVNLTKELAAQWSRRGVRVNALCPGWFRTEMTDDMFADEGGQKWIRRRTVMGRPGEEHELDGALLWLASDASSYVTGSAIVVDGGFLAM